MIIKLKRKTFSKLEDDMYRGDQNERRRSVRNAPLGLAVAGGLTGAMLGGATGKAEGVLLGGAAGAGLGYYGGKKLKKKVNRDVDHSIKRYEGSNEHDKRYLRERYERDLDRNIQREQARAMRSQARAMRSQAHATWSRR